MKNMELKMSSNKSFGVVFSLFFFIISFYPTLNDEEIKIWSLIICLILLLISFIYPKILTPFNKIWFKFGILLGAIISPIVMGFVFFMVVTPTSLIMKLLGKDLLNLKKNNKNSYWIENTTIKSKMKNQF